MNTTLAELIREQMAQDDVLANIKEDLIKALATNIREEGKAHISFRGRDEEKIEKPSWSETYYISIHFHKETALKMWLSEQGFRYRDTYAWQTGRHGLDVSVF